MKSASSRYASVAGIALLTALSTVCQLSAATNPLNGPRAWPLPPMATFTLPTIRETTLLSLTRITPG